MRRIASAVFVGSVLVAAASAGGAEPSKKIPDRFTVRCFRTAAPAGPFSAIEPSVALFLQAGQRGHVSFSEPARKDSPCEPCKATEPTPKNESKTSRPESIRGADVRNPSADGRKDASPRENADSRVTVHVSVVAQGPDAVTIDVEIERTDCRAMTVFRLDRNNHPEMAAATPSRTTQVYRIQRTIKLDQFGTNGLILPTAPDAFNKRPQVEREADYTADRQAPRGDWILLDVTPRFSDGLVIAPTTNGKFARRTAAFGAIFETGTASLVEGALPPRCSMIDGTPAADLLETTGQLAKCVYCVPHRPGLPEALVLLDKCVQAGWLSRAEEAFFGRRSILYVTLWDSPVLMESLAALDRLSPEEKAELSITVYTVGGPSKHAYTTRGRGKHVEARFASFDFGDRLGTMTLHGVETRIDPPPAAPPAK